jgi:CelD/BcsL family acetyltransferase involved in cellulose biosynthesis
MNVPPREAPNAHLPPHAQPGAAAPTREVCFYDNEVPAFAETELERLYECVMTTVARFAIYNAAPGASTYLVREHGLVTALFLFRREARQVVVYNEQVTLGRSELNRFADAVFARYPSVRRISFYAIDAPARGVRYPMLRRECLEDIRLALPPSTDEYLESLGSHTRATVRRYRRHLQRDFPSFRFQVYDGSEASDDQVRQIVALNRARMNAKGQVSYHTDAAVEQLVQLVRKYGLLCVATIDERIVGGAICTRVGSTYQLVVLAHDPLFDKYRLGRLCCCFSICHAIEQGGAQYVFGWSRYDYKFRLNGREKPLYRVVLYRSRRHMLVDAAHVARIAAAAAIRRFRLRAARAEAGSSRADPWIRSLAHALRRVRRLLRRLRRASAQPSRTVEATHGPDKLA